MSIEKADHIPSWQIGFEDGIKFLIKFLMKHYTFVPIIVPDECEHLWNTGPGMRWCDKCGKRE